MGIHAKSLNQLVNELEDRRHSRAQDAAPLRRADEMQVLIKGLQALAQEVTQQLKGTPSSAAPPVPDTVPEPPTVLMDTTLGIRTRIRDRAELRKVENSIRLDMGFVSRGDIAGDN